MRRKTVKVGIALLSAARPGHLASFKQRAQRRPFDRDSSLDRFADFGLRGVSADRGHVLQNGLRCPARVGLGLLYPQQHGAPFGIEIEHGFRQVLSQREIAKRYHAKKSTVAYHMLHHIAAPIRRMVQAEANLNADVRRSGARDFKFQVRTPQAGLDPADSTNLLGGGYLVMQRFVYFGPAMHQMGLALTSKLKSMPVTVIDAFEKTPRP